MKKALLLVLPLFFLLQSCYKQAYGPVPPVDESYWLSQDRAIVAYSDFDCDYYVVETYEGYSLLRAWGGFSPARGSVLYGNFSHYGVGTYYNRSGGYLLQADVRGYWMSYFEAMDQLQWNCQQGL